MMVANQYYMVNEINICWYDREKDREIRATKEIKNVCKKDITTLFEQQTKLIGNEIVFNEGAGEKKDGHEKRYQYKRYGTEED